MRSIISAPFALFTLLVQVLRLLWDERVSFRLKLLPLAALAYVLSPIDLLPDRFPILGRIDDLMVAGLLLLVFAALGSVEKAARAAGAAARGGTGQHGSAPPTIEGRFRVLDDDEE